MITASTGLEFIEDITGADIPIMDITREFGTTRDFTPGATSPGEHRLPGASARGVGEHRHGGDSMAGGGILIPFMLRRITG